jgi:hypothetical protein
MPARFEIVDLPRHLSKMASALCNLSWTLGNSIDLEAQRDDWPKLP